LKVQKAHIIFEVKDLKGSKRKTNGVMKRLKKTRFFANSNGKSIILSERQKYSASRFLRQPKGKDSNFKI
jgi:hypothetical protein